MVKRDKNIVLIGMPGCGKTTIGKLLAQRLCLEFCDIDKFIEKKYKTTIADMFKIGEDYFRKIESTAVEEVGKISPKIISTGGGVVKSYRNIEVLRKNGIIIFINRPLENIISDIDTVSRPLLADGKERIYKLFHERYHLYKKYCDYEIMNDADIDLVLKNIIHVIEKGSGFNETINN